MGILLKIQNSLIISYMLCATEYPSSHIQEDEVYIPNIDNNLLIKIQPNLTKYENGQFDFSNNNEELYREKIRDYRIDYCFNIVNRGQVWYNKLINEQKAELQTWYQAWLDAPETLIIPEKPEWI